MVLVFDEKRLINDIIKEIHKEMELVAKVIIDSMTSDINMMPAHNASFTKWKQDVISLLHWKSVDSANQVLLEVGVLNQSDPSLYKAMAVEFGTGTRAMSNLNPWFSEFLSSEWYHSSRDGMAISSLPDEMVYDPDKGGWHGSQAITRDPLPFLEEEGSLFWTNIFGNGSIIAESYFNKGIDLAISRIDFSNYLEMK